MKLKMIWSAQLLLVGLCALALKFYYSTATPNDLLWILAPTTALVELFSGQQFEFESYAGYMSSDHRFLIAVPCAGVNFLITAFVMVAWRRLWRERFGPQVWYTIPVAAAIAYVATIIANAARICLALELRARSVEVDWLTNNQLHRLEGIVVYFGFLLLLFVLLERFDSEKPIKLNRVLVFPLLVYYAIALGVPLANGAYRQGSAFWEHSVFVLVLPLVLIVPVFLLSLVSRSDESPFRPGLSIPGSFPSRRWRTSGTSRRQCQESRPPY
ncbi:MAG TPA: exosortase K [Pyrinomonadaceae bacterium]|nr:exosortase K [Pyrinomonadaceae bacterium]